jgi:hypothetical protein
MARATNTNNSARKPRMSAVADVQKRKPGRPVGSTNAKKAASATSAKATAKRSASPKAAPAPRLNKAELEIQVGKLERTIARLRDKNKELKQAAIETRNHLDTLEAELASKPAAETRKPARKARSKPAPKPVAETGSETTDEQVVEA